MGSHSKEKSRNERPVDLRLPSRGLRKLESPVEKPGLLNHKFTTEGIQQTRERAGRKRTIMAEEIQVVRGFPDRI